LTILILWLSVIKQYLTDNKIEYKQEELLPIITLKKYRYDFLFTYNNRQYIIEFDGEQHFKYTNQWHRDEDHFQQCQLTDRLKTYACLMSNITLIRIQKKELSEIKHFMDTVGLKSSKQLIVDDLDECQYLLDPPITLEQVSKINANLKTIINIKDYISTV
jgi:very-short-patch-repair endonuclease